MPEEATYAGEDAEHPHEYTDYEVGKQDGRLEALEELEDALLLAAGNRKWNAGQWWSMLLGRVNNLERNNQQPTAIGTPR